MPAGVPDAALSTVIRSPLTSVLADNVAVNTVTVTLTDSELDPVPAYAITAEATANGTGVTIVGPAGGVTDENGQAVFTVKSTTIHPSPDQTEVTFTADAITLQDTANIEFLGGFTVSAPSLSFFLTPDGPPRLGKRKLLTVTSVPVLAEITAAKVGAVAWLTIPATFTNATAETVEVDYPTAGIYRVGRVTETIRFSQAGYTSADVVVTMHCAPGGRPG